MQNIFIIGRLTEDAALKSSTRQGVKSEFVTFKVACNEEKGDERSATFYDAKMNKTGIFDYLKKGQMVGVAGRFRFTQAKDDKGNLWPHLNITVTDIQLIGGSKKQEAEQAAPEQN